MPLISQEKKYKGLSAEEINYIKQPAWGASLNWIYLLVMRAYWPAVLIAVLSVIPVINIVVFIALIFMGREFAWKYRSWISFSEYKTVQEKWDKGAKIYWIVIIGLAIIYFIWLWLTSLLVLILVS